MVFRKKTSSSKDHTSDSEPRSTPRSQAATISSAARSTISPVPSKGNASLGSRSNRSQKAPKPISPSPPPKDKNNSETRSTRFPNTPKPIASSASSKDVSETESRSPRSPPTSKPIAATLPTRRQPQAPLALSQRRVLAPTSALPYKQAQILPSTLSQIQNQASSTTSTALNHPALHVNSPSSTTPQLPTPMDRAPVFHLPEAYTSRLSRLPKPTASATTVATRPCTSLRQGLKNMREAVEKKIVAKPAGAAAKTTTVARMKQAGKACKGILGEAVSMSQKLMDAGDVARAVKGLDGVGRCGDGSQVGAILPSGNEADSTGVEMFASDQAASSAAADQTFALEKRDSGDFLGKERPEPSREESKSSTKSSTPNARAESKAAQTTQAASIENVAPAVQGRDAPSAVPAKVTQRFRIRSQNLEHLFPTQRNPVAEHAQDGSRISRRASSMQAGMRFKLPLKLAPQDIPLPQTPQGDEGRYGDSNCSDSTPKSEIGNRLQPDGRPDPRQSVLREQLNGNNHAQWPTPPKMWNWADSVKEEEGEEEQDSQWAARASRLEYCVSMLKDEASAVLASGVKSREEVSAEEDESVHAIDFGARSAAIQQEAERLAQEAENMANNVQEADSIVHVSPSANAPTAPRAMREWQERQDSVVPRQSHSWRRNQNVNQYQHRRRYDSRSMPRNNFYNRNNYQNYGNVPRGGDPPVPAPTSYHPQQFTTPNFSQTLARGSSAYAPPSHYEVSSMPRGGFANPQPHQLRNFNNRTIRGGFYNAGISQPKVSYREYVEWS